MEAKPHEVWTNYLLEVDTPPHWKRQKPLRYRVACNGQRLARGTDLKDMARVFPAVAEEVASWLGV